MPSGIPENASVQQAILSKILKILSIFQLALGILTMFVDIFSGLMLMIGALVLYLITYSRNWCTCVIYIVLCMMDLVTTTMLIGNYFTKHGHIESEYGIILFFSMIKLPFYALSIFYTFLSYRELKALFMEIAMGMPGQFISSPPVAPPQNNVFSGPGYRIN